MTAEEERYIIEQLEEEEAYCEMCQIKWPEEEDDGCSEVPEGERN